MFTLCLNILVLLGAAGIRCADLGHALGNAGAVVLLEDHLLNGENKDTLSTGGFEFADDFPETFLVKNGMN